MPDYTWTIGTDRSDGGIVVNGETSGSTPSYTRGDRGDLNFALWYDPSIDTDPSGHVDRYEKLREYGDFAGSMNVNRSANGIPHYTERVPASAPVDTLVLDFVPGADVDATPGFWAIVRSVDDPTRYPQDTARLNMSVTVLAELGEYADRTALEAELREGVV